MKNFGLIKEHVTKQLSRSVLNEDTKGKKLFEEFIKTINKSPILKTQYSVYNNIENKYIESEIKATRYINENLDLFKEFKYKDLIKENDKLSKFDYEGEKIVGCSCTDKLYEDLDILIKESVKTNPNIDKKHDSFDGVLEYIMTEDNKVNNDNEYKMNNNTYFSNKYIIESAINKFNEKYSNFSEQEKEIFKVLFEDDSEGKRRVFSELKENNLDLIKKTIQESDDKELKDKLSLVEEKLSSMEYSDDSYVSDIIKLDKLSSGF